MQIIFQIVLASLGQEIIPHCGSTEILLRHVGLVRLDKLDVVSITKWVAPEVISLVGSVIVFFVTKGVSDASGDAGTVEDGNQNSPSRTDNELTPAKWKILASLGKITSLVALCVAGALQPSVLSFIYYIVFLGALSWWACNKKLERFETKLILLCNIYRRHFRAFGIVLRITLVFLAVHLTALLVYQNPWPQKQLLPNSTIARSANNKLYFSRLNHRFF